MTPDDIPSGPVDGAPTQKANHPEKRFKAGAISATVWKAKEGSNKTVLVVFEKSYKNKDGKWATTNHFTIQDLATVAWLAKQAFSYALERRESRP